MILILKVDKIASESSYKTVKLWEIYDYIFTNFFKFVKNYENFVP